MTTKNICQELKDDILEKVCGGSSETTVNQKDGIKRYLTVKGLYNVARAFELNLKSSLAIAMNERQNNISVSVANDSVSVTCNNIVYGYEDIMKKLTSYYGA